MIPALGMLLEHTIIVAATRSVLPSLKLIMTTATPIMTTLPLPHDHIIPNYNATVPHQPIMTTQPCPHMTTPTYHTTQPHPYIMTTSHPSIMTCCHAHLMTTATPTHRHNGNFLSPQCSVHKRSLLCTTVSDKSFHPQKSTLPCTWLNYQVCIESKFILISAHSEASWSSFMKLWETVSSISIPSLKEIGLCREWGISPSSTTNKCTL